jgi:protocatechuate 3,4-dioxygenase beta subunit
MAPALTPVQRPGPFYFSSRRRTVLAEDSAGAPFALTLVVKDADGYPIPAAVVALWHADERGVYALGVDETGKDFVGIHRSRVAVVNTGYVFGRCQALFSR